MIKFILDAMYYQIFIFNRDKFILENPHERTIQIICGILFLPVIVLVYLLIEENFNYKTPFAIDVLPTPRIGHDISLNYRFGFCSIGSDIQS